ncbi:MAG: TatD family hydrolase, partial [Alistipes sp.]|nr:TatD family hydrolase [Alistipes sp.]
MKEESAGYSLESSKEAIEIAKNYDFMKAIVGISPNDISEFKKENLVEIEELAKNEKVVAIGE